MTTIGNESRPAYVYDADTDTWVPIGFGPHTHDEYIDKTIITTKGDIIVGTATEAVERLGVGAEGSVLIADPTSPTGLAWGEAGGSITVSTTAPEEPGEGDLWFNSTNATTYIYYDGFWVEQSPAIAGPKGEPGIVASASEPSDTDVIWLDTDEEPDVPVPAGGTTGQVLIKSSSDDYDTDWVNPPSGNAIINGGFDIWQRGTSFTNPATAGSYTADRWAAFFQGNGTLTQDTSLVPDNSRFGARITATATSAGNILLQSIETQNAIQFAGKTMTVSGVYAGTVGLNPTVSVTFSTTVDQTLFNITTSIPATSSSIPTSTGSFQQFTAVFSVPSTARTLRIGLNTGAVVNTNFLTFGQIQLEAGPVATPFRRNANSLQGELAACQRYYYESASAAQYFTIGSVAVTTETLFAFPLPVRMRAAPSLSVSAAGDFTLQPGGIAISSFVQASSSPDVLSFYTTSTGLTANQAKTLFAANSNARIKAAAEL